MSETLNSTRVDSGSSCLSPTLTRSFALVRSINQKLYKKPTNCATSWLAVPTFLFHMPLPCSRLHFPVPLCYSLFPVPASQFPVPITTCCCLQFNFAASQGSAQVEVVVVQRRGLPQPALACLAGSAWRKTRYNILWKAFPSSVSVSDFVAINK